MQVTDALHTAHCGAYSTLWSASNYSQYFMERYAGYIKHGLNATTRAAESLFENARESEAWKLFSGVHFIRGDEGMGETGEEGPGEVYVNGESSVFLDSIRKEN